jgi:hypothetical protein
VVNDQAKEDEEKTALNSEMSNLITSIRSQIGELAGLQKSIVLNKNQKFGEKLELDVVLKTLLEQVKSLSNYELEKINPSEISEFVENIENLIGDDIDPLDILIDKIVIDDTTGDVFDSGDVFDLISDLDFESEKDFEPENNEVKLEQVGEISNETHELLIKNANNFSEESILLFNAIAPFMSTDEDKIEKEAGFINKINSLLDIANNFINKIDTTSNFPNVSESDFFADQNELSKVNFSEAKENKTEREVQKIITLVNDQAKEDEEKTKEAKTFQAKDWFNNKKLLRALEKVANCNFEKLKTALNSNEDIRDKQSHFGLV